MIQKSKLLFLIFRNLGDFRIAGDFSIFESLQYLGRKLLEFVIVNWSI